MAMTDDEAKKVPAVDVTLAVIVAGPGTVPLFKMTETLPAPSVVPEAVLGVPSPGAPMYVPPPGPTILKFTFTPASGAVAASLTRKTMVEVVI
jgi:hypothetical protein